MVTLEELLNDETIQDIIKYVKQYDLDKVVLFGSRAKGIARKFSDYDLLIYGDELSMLDYYLFLTDEYLSPYSFDVVIDCHYSKELKEEVYNTWVVIYEKVRPKR